MTINYASRDYDTIKSDLLARAARVYPDWTDRDPSDFGMLLVDLWAHAADVSNYYADRAAKEAFLSTATKRDSVLAIANLLDYRPRGRASAVGNVTIRNDTDSAFPVGAGTEFVARHNDSTFVLYARDGGIIPANGSAIVVANEGAIIEEEVLTDSASGLSGQVYTLADQRAAAGTITIDVYEDGVTAVPYSYVERISQAGAGARVFSTRIGTSGSLEVRFGTLLNGFVPPSGATVTATYSACSGQAGNISSDTITGFKSSVTPGISVLSNSAFTGGSNEESIESMRISIPSVAATQDRAVSREDFIALTNTIEGVSKSTIVFTQGAGTANNTVTIYAQPFRADFLETTDTSQAVDSDLQDLIETVVQPKSILGTDVVAASTIDWEPIDVSMDVHVNQSYVTNSVKNNVVAAIDRLFEFDSVLFGQLLHLGQVQRIVLNVPGVNYVVVTRFTESSTAPGSVVDPTIQIDGIKIPKKGTVATTMIGGISTSG